MSDEALRRIVEAGSEAGATARDLVGSALADAPEEGAKARARARLEAALAHDGITTGVAALSSAMAARLVVPVLSPIETSHRPDGSALRTTYDAPAPRRRDLSLPLAAGASLSVLLVGAVIVWNVLRSDAPSSSAASTATVAPLPPAPVVNTPPIAVAPAPVPNTPPPPIAPAPPLAGTTGGSAPGALAQAGGSAMPSGGAGGGGGGGGAPTPPSTAGTEPVVAAAAGGGGGAHSAHVRGSHGAAHASAGGGARAIASASGGSGACGARCHGDIGCLLRCSTHGSAAAGGGGGSHPGGGGGGGEVAVSPSRGDVMTAMGNVRAAVATCHGRLTGMAPVAVTFGSNGHVVNASVGAPFQGTPQGLCISRAVGRAAVPRFSRPTFSVNYPFSIR